MASGSSKTSISPVFKCRLFYCLPPPTVTLPVPPAFADSSRVASEDSLPLCRVLFSEAWELGHPEWSEAGDRHVEWSAGSIAPVSSGALGSLSGRGVPHGPLRAFFYLIPVRMSRSPSASHSEPQVGFTEGGISLKLTCWAGGDCCNDETCGGGGKWMFLLPWC